MPKRLDERDFWSVYTQIRQQPDDTIDSAVQLMVARIVDSNVSSIGTDDIQGGALALMTQKVLRYNGDIRGVAGPVSPIQSCSTSIGFLQMAI